MIRGHLLEYKPDSYDWLIDSKKTYQRNVSIVTDGFKKLDDLLTVGSLTAKCEPVISAGWTCSFGYSHAPGECNATSFVYVLNITMTCNGGGGNTSNNYNTNYINDPINGGVGGGSESNGNGGVVDEPGGLDDGTSTTTPTGDMMVTFSPENPINDMNDYLECFNTNQSATVTVYALEPNPGSGDTHNGSYVGHTFVSIQQGNNTATFGFYPASDNIYPLINNSSPSVIGDDSGDPYTASISTTVTGSQLNTILNYAKNYENTYHLNTYNCTDFGIEIGNKAGLNLPDSYGTWTMGGGSNPGTLGLYLLNRNSTNSQPINKNGGTAPQTNKGC